MQTNLTQDEVSASELSRAVAALRAEALVAFPTETVYGLGADARSDRAVAAIFAAKKRPRFNPLIVHVASLEAAQRVAVFDRRALDLARAFWPGPLTLVLPARPESGISLLARAGLDSVAVRVPAHPVAQALLTAFGGPVVAPSANRSGRVSPTEPAHVRADFSDEIAVLLEGGPCAIGLESTIVGLLGAHAELLRPGAVARQRLDEVLGPGELIHSPDPGLSTDFPTAPGQLRSHYAPSRPVRLEARSVRSDEALLAFGSDVPAGARLTLNLSPRGDLAEAAANLFAFLRRLDRPDISAIAVMPVPESGLGEAINDRLRRAAAPREESS